MESKLVPYLNFDGTAAEAMGFYQLALGGELTMQTFEDAFPNTPDENKKRIMHAFLKSGMIELMASDTHPEQSEPYRPGNNVNVSIIGTDAEKLTECFNKLSEGGRVIMPLEKQFWGDTFGSFEDKYGITWMVNISSIPAM